MAGDKLEFDGIVKAAHGNGMFSIESQSMGKTLICRLSGKIRKNNIKILEGDKVKFEVSPYDLEKGVITFRTK